LVELGPSAFLKGHDEVHESPKYPLPVHHLESSFMFSGIGEQQAPYDLKIIRVILLVEGGQSAGNGRWGLCVWLDSKSYLEKTVNDLLSNISPMILKQCGG